MNTRSLAASAALVLSLASAGPARGQASAYNRRILAAAVEPSGGKLELSAAVRVELGAPVSTPLNLGTEVHFLRDGALLGVLTLPQVVQPSSGTCGPAGSCAGSCGFSTWGPMGCATHIPTGTHCVCANSTLAALPVDEGSLKPGDEITVILRPAPGALPEPDPSGDLQSLAYKGKPVFWNRAVQSIELAPDPSAPGKVVATAHFGLGVSGFGGAADLSLDVALLVNGASQQTVHYPAFSNDLISPTICTVTGQCGAPCGNFDGGLTAHCTSSILAQCGAGGTLGCVLCSGCAETSFAGVAVKPGDEIAIIIYPAPGTLPELPKHASDDKLSIAAPSLIGAPAEISIATGGVQSFALLAGPAHGGELYLLAGTLAGTSPGIPLGAIVVPLNPDALFFLAVNAPNKPPYSGNLGFLKPTGTASASFALPGGLPASLAGAKVHHAFAVLDVPGTGAPLLASPAVELELVP